MSAKPDRKWMRAGSVAICALALAAAWECHGRLIAPLRKLEAAAVADAGDMRERIGRAQKTIVETRTLEQDPAGARSQLRSLLGNRPSGSALVWFPARIEKHFGRLNGEGVVARFNSVLEQPELPDFERSHWAVEMPVGDTAAAFRDVCAAIADFESADPALRVLDVVIQPVPNDPMQRRLVMNLSFLCRKLESGR
jgi:hypothetical protein